ncbi:MAG: hypothetical protein HRT52_22260 [Colwellia sp.]|nr:hypothetical protein [Colwellia sp.]
MDNLQLQKLNSHMNDAPNLIESFTGGINTFCEFRAINLSNNLVENLKGSITDLDVELRRLNDAGYDIFITVNQTDGIGIKAKNITAIRAFTMDFDDADADNLRIIKSLPVKPSMVIETSPNKFHVWFMLNENDSRLHLFKLIQLALANKYNTDKSIIDLPRVMRLPSFYHRKSTPFLSRIIEDNGTYFSIEQLTESFDIDLTAIDKPVINHSNKTGINDYLDTEINRNQFIKHLNQIVKNGEHIPTSGINGNNVIVKHIAPWGHDYGLPVEVAEELIWEYLNPHCLPPWEEKEREQLFGFIKQGYKAAKNEIGFLARKPFPPVPVPIGGWDEQNKRRIEHLKLTNRNIAPSYSEATNKLATSIELLIKKKANVVVSIDKDVVEKMISSSFYSPQKSAIYLLNDKDNLIEAKGNDRWVFLTKTFGQVVNIDEYIKSLESEALKDNLNKTESQKFLNEMSKVPSKAITEHIRYENQRTSLAFSVDMFSEHGRIEIQDELAKVIFTHQPLPHKEYNNEIIDDYKEHYPEFDSFIEWIVNCRFAGDRKLAYMWIHADSDWGKGFLLSVMGEHSLSVELSIKEIEKMFEGAPVGRSMVDFKRAVVLVIDEFKSVKSELKQLQNQLTISPKNQLSAKVDIFAKLFTSAEHVHSLVGESGIENQFANRFSYFRYTGSLNKRNLFNEVGKYKYLQSVKYYFAEKFNTLVNQLTLLGKDAASKQADRYLKEFHEKNGIGNEFDLLSESLKDIAKDVVKHTYKHNFLEVISHEDKAFLKTPSKIISNYIKTKFDDSESFTLMKKRAEIRSLMCVQGTVYGTQRAGQESFKGIRIR